VRFRPCIDLHQGQVKQIVGGSLRDAPGTAPVTNYVAVQPAGYFAAMYRRDGLDGGHVIMLGPGNERAAAAALAAYPNGLQIGGGITPDNAPEWLERGAAKVIVTSYVFRDGQVDWGRLGRMTTSAGRERLVLDLSCRRQGSEYFIVTDRWQRFTAVTISASNLERLAESCSEFLIHAVDVEGLQQGVDPELLCRLGEWSRLPTTYAGGIATPADIERVRVMGRGRLDYTVGSALDIFGGRGLCYRELVDLDRREHTERGVLPPAAVAP
jgi:phosphoribosylformimino-5-aminoimidazole carboxamide ribotide isomerase